LSPYSFLAALPAILGFAGFVLYQSLGTNRSGDEITRRIVDKLRKNAPSKVERDQRLTGSQLERLLARDQGLQRLIGEQDFALLRQALHQQFILSLTVYSIAILFCALSVVLFVRQAQAKQKLQVDHWSVSSTDRNSGGVPVDLDNLHVSWRSSGEPEDTKLYLENIQTSSRTAPQIAPSSANSMEFLPDTYQEGRKQTDHWLPDKPAYLRIFLDIPGQNVRVKHNEPLGKCSTREEARRKADRWIMTNGINDREKFTLVQITIWDFEARKRLSI
jgi:hypothetical protein